jgi:hypothetical protein
VLPKQDQQMPKHSPLPQPPAPSPRPPTLDPHTGPRTLETHPRGALEDFELVIPQQPCAAVLSLGEAEAAVNTSDVGVDHPLHCESAGGDSSP